MNLVNLTAKGVIVSLQKNSPTKLKKHALDARIPPREMSLYFLLFFFSRFLGSHDRTFDRDELLRKMIKDIEIIDGRVPSCPHLAYVHRV